MNNIIKIPVFMLNEEAKQFLLFQQHYETFNLLLKSDVFLIRNGKAELHFDSLGKLKSIRRSDILYDERFDKSLSTDL